MKQSEDKQKLVERSREKAAVCSALLVDLCREAGAADSDSLPDSIEKAPEKRRISGELSDCEDSLISFAGGETIAQLVVDLEALNVDELPNRIAQLQQQVEAFRKENADCDQSLGASRLELKQKIEERCGSSRSARIPESGV